MSGGGIIINGSVVARREDGTVIDAAAIPHGDTVTMTSTGKTTWEITPEPGETIRYSRRVAPPADPNKIPLTYNEQVGGAEEWLPSAPIPQGKPLRLTYNGVVLERGDTPNFGVYIRNYDGDSSAFNIWPPDEMDPIGPRASVIVEILSSLSNG